RSPRGLPQRRRARGSVQHPCYSRRQPTPASRRQPPLSPPPKRPEPSRAAGATERKRTSAVSMDSSSSSVGVTSMGVGFPSGQPYYSADDGGVKRNLGGVAPTR